MNTCPNCGSMVMRGDPYCSHCGAHFNWSDDEEEFEKVEYEYEKSLQEKMERIWKGQNFDPFDEPILKEKVKEFLSAKDCTDFRIEPRMLGLAFIFTRENEYVRTVDEFIYDFDYQKHERIFTDCRSHHCHDGLVSNPRFTKMIDDTGLEFLECRGGYLVDVRFGPFDMVMLDEIEIYVHLKSGSSTRIYRLDLDRMELDDDYYEWDW